MGEGECKRACQSNCSCVAYASLQIDGGGGCMAWHGELMDTLILAEQGKDFYVRADGTESAENDRKPRGFLRRRETLVVLILPVLLAHFLIMLAYWWLIKRKTEVSGRGVMLCSCLKKLSGSTLVLIFTSLLKLSLKYL
ncbi:hypothetical protein ACLB2K_032698 [Fragaria x ananassa]